jgi:hypothetical protein
LFRHEILSAPQRRLRTSHPLAGIITGERDLREQAWLIRGSSVETIGN